MEDDADAVNCHLRSTKPLPTQSLDALLYRHHAPEHHLTHAMPEERRQKPGVVYVLYITEVWRADQIDAYFFASTFIMLLHKGGQLDSASLYSVTSSRSCGSTVERHCHTGVCLAAPMIGTVALQGVARDEHVIMSEPHRRPAPGLSSSRMCRRSSEPREEICSASPLVA